MKNEESLRPHGILHSSFFILDSSLFQRSECRFVIGFLRDFGNQLGVYHLSFRIDDYYGTRQQSAQYAIAPYIKLNNS